MAANEFDALLTADKGKDCTVASLVAWHTGAMTRQCFYDLLRA